MLRLLVLAFVALSPCIFHAQVTGFLRVGHCFAANEPLGLAGYGVHNVYAFTDSEDVLGAVYSDVVALDTPPMGIDAPCGCINPLRRRSWWLQQQPRVFTPFPEYEYDSFWTIGMSTSVEDGQLPASIGMGAATDLCSGLNIENGSLTSQEPQVTGPRMLWREMT